MNRLISRAHGRSNLADRLFKFTVLIKISCLYYSPSLLFLLLIPRPTPAVAREAPPPCAFHGGSPTAERRAPSMEGAEWRQEPPRRCPAWSTAVRRLIMARRGRVDAREKILKRLCSLLLVSLSLDESRNGELGAEISAFSSFFIINRMMSEFFLIGSSADQKKDGQKARQRLS